MSVRPRRSAVTWAFGATTLLASLAACSSGHANTVASTVPIGTGASGTSPGSPTSGSAVTAGSGTATTSPAPAGGLSGSWSGHYSGSFTGSFSLTWQQSGSTLSGTITIPQLHSDPIPISGSLQGSSIRFGTVGSQQVTYSGTLSGGSMSGNWQIVVSGKTLGSGSWNASRA